MVVGEGGRELHVNKSSIVSVEVFIFCVSVS